MISIDISSQKRDGPQNQPGERQTTHIIPLAIKSVLNNQTFKLFGTDYDTKDGTCVRDYIHVLDLVEAHLLALAKIIESNGEYFYNVGTGIGITNREVVDMVSKVSGKD